MENKIKTIQKAYEEFGKGNIQGVVDLLQDDVSWTDSGGPEIPHSKKRKGKSDVINFFAELGKAVTFDRFEPRRFLNDGNIVVATGFFSGQGNATGKAFESDWVMVWEVVDGKVKSYDSYFDTVKMASVLK